MAYDQPGLKLGVLIAGADLSAAQFMFVKVHASGRVVKCDTQGEEADGVLYNKPTSGQPAELCGSRVAKVVCGASVTAGDKVMTDSAGKAITATSNNYNIGKALAGGASGEIIPVLLKMNGKV